jgi:hypothetical protein
MNIKQFTEGLRVSGAGKAEQLVFRLWHLMSLSLSDAPISKNLGRKIKTEKARQRF